MSTLTHPVPQVRPSRYSLLIKAAQVVFFWALAAVPVIAVDAAVDTVTPEGAIAIKVGSIIAVAWLYAWTCARNCSVDSALFVGVAWLLLDIAAEMGTTAYTGHGWFDLIGAPANHATRYLLLFTWVCAPALFARLPGLEARS